MTLTLILGVGVGRIWSLYLEQTYLLIISHYVLPFVKFAEIRFSCLQVCVQMV